LLQSLGGKLLVGAQRLSTILQCSPTLRHCLARQLLFLPELGRQLRKALPVLLHGRQQHPQVSLQLYGAGEGQRTPVLIHGRQDDFTILS